MSTSKTTSRKSARSIIEHKELLPPTKKFNAIHISSDSNGIKRKSDFHPESDPSVFDLKGFEYLWRTKFDENARSEDKAGTFIL
jgi:hypothetical protein